MCDEKMLFKLVQKHWQNILLVLVLLAMLFYEKPVENRPQIKPLIRTEKQHIVRTGEDVFKIADIYFPQQQGTSDYARFVFAIKHENGMLEGRRIRPNDVLIIPLMVEAE